MIAHRKGRSATTVRSGGNDTGLIADCNILLAASVLAARTDSAVVTYTAGDELPSELGLLCWGRRRRLR